MRRRAPVVSFVPFFVAFVMNQPAAGGAALPTGWLLRADLRFALARSAGSRDDERKGAGSCSLPIAPQDLYRG